MTTDTTTVERFLECFERQRFADLAELYAPDATFALHVGDHDEHRRGAAAIVARYIDDYDPPPTFLRWGARTASWGAVVEGDAIQDRGSDRFRYCWVHILTIEEDRIVDDTIYCSGAVPVADLTTVAGPVAQERLTPAGQGRAAAGAGRRIARRGG